MRKLTIALIAVGAILFYENIAREPLTEGIIESILEAKLGRTWVLLRGFLASFCVRMDRQRRGHDILVRLVLREIWALLFRPSLKNSTDLCHRGLADRANHNGLRGAQCRPLQDYANVRKLVGHRNGIRNRKS